MALPLLQTHAITYNMVTSNPVEDEYDGAFAASIIENTFMTLRLLF